MTASVPSIMAQIAVIQRLIVDPATSRAAVAFDNVPYTLSRADMPAFVTFIKPLIRNTLAGSDDTGRDFDDTRTYDMILYHSPFGTGISEEKIGDLTPWFDLVYTEFSKWPHLKQTAGVVDALIVNDGGAGVHSFIGQQYYGIRFTLQIIRRSRWLLGKGD